MNDRINLSSSVFSLKFLQQSASIDDHEVSYRECFYSLLIHCLKELWEMAQWLGYLLFCRGSLQDSANWPESAEVARGHQHTTRSLMVSFSLWRSDKWSSTMQRKVDQYMCVVSEWLSGLLLWTGTMTKITLRRTTFNWGWFTGSEVLLSSRWEHGSIQAGMHGAGGAESSTCSSEGC